MDTPGKEIKQDTSFGKDDSDSRNWTDNLLKKPTFAAMPVDRDAYEYNMKHKSRGKAIIFNNKNFASASLNPRNGTDEDRYKLKSCLLVLGFDVKVYDDAKAREVMDVIKHLSMEDHSERDCILIAVFSHGDRNMIHAYDDYYKPESLFDPFRADCCPTLAGKPKLFLIQACQGDQVDGGTMLKRFATETDSVDSSAHKQYIVPNQADFLVVFSTVPGYYSWRNTTEGSWFIQAVCQVLNKYAEKKDVLSMLTIIARYVALDFESCVPGNPMMDRKKQIPFITSTLTRDIYLRK